jgi:hypothetical protein
VPDGANGVAFARGRPPLSPRGDAAVARGGDDGAEEYFPRAEAEASVGATTHPFGASFGGVSRSASPAPFFAEGSFAAGLEVGGVNRLEGRINLLAQRVEDIAARCFGSNEGTSSRLESLAREHSRLRARLEERDRAGVGVNTAVLLAAAASGAMLAGCVAAAFAYGRGGR